MYREIRKMHLNDIHIAKYNPRHMSDEEYSNLVHNIDTKGYLELIIVNKQTGYTIVSGNHRKRALLELGYDEIEVIVIDVSLPEEKALNIAMNRIGGIFDEEKLEEVLSDIKNFGVLEFTGLSDFELDNVFGDFDDNFGNLETDVFKTDNEISKDKVKESFKEKKPKRVVVCPHCGEEIPLET